MSDLRKSETIQFDPDIHAALCEKISLSNQTISEIVNEAVRLALEEDKEDVAAIADRASKTTMSYETLRHNLRSHGKLRDYVQKFGRERPTSRPNS